MSFPVSAPGATAAPSAEPVAAAPATTAPAAPASAVPAESSEDGAPAAPAGPRRLADVAREATLTAEKAAIAVALQQVHWNRRKAAQLLGVSYKTLLNKIKETGIERP